MITYSKLRGGKTLSSLIFDFHQKHSTKREISFLETKLILNEIVKSNDYFGYLKEFEDITNFIIDTKRNEVDINKLSFDEAKKDALIEILEKYNNFVKEYNLADLGDIEKFVYENINEKYDIDEFEREGIHFFTSKLQKKIVSKISKNIIKETLPNNNAEIKTIEAFDEFDEVVKTFKMIKELLDKGENDIKIFTTDIDRYFKIFESLSYEYKIPIFSSKGVELKRYQKGRQIAKQKAKLTHDKLKKLNIKVDIQELENQFLNERFLYKKGIEITETNQIFIHKNIKHLFLVGANIDNFPPSREKNIFYTPEFEKVFFKNNLYTSTLAILNRMKKIAQNIYTIHQTDKLSILIEKNPLNKNFSFTTQKENNKKEYTKTPYTPKNISVSQINTYNKCPKQYFFKYVLNLTAPTQNKDEMEITLKGKILHKALEISAKEKLDDIDMIIEKTYNDEEIKKELKNDIYETIYKIELKPIIKNFLEYIKNIDTSNSKFEYNIYLDENLQITDEKNYYLKGVIDRLDIDDKITIIDYKSSENKSKNKDMLNLKDIQLGLYTYWAKQKFDKEVEAYLISFKKEISQFATLKECEEEYIKKGRSIKVICYNKEYENKILNHIKTITKKIKNGEFDYIDEPDCEYCEFEKICKTTQSSTK